MSRYKLMHISLWMVVVGEGEGGGCEVLQKHAAIFFSAMGADAGQATLNSSSGFIVLAVDRVRACSSPRHEDFVSIGHEADIVHTDKLLSRSQGKTLQRS